MQIRVSHKWVKRPTETPGKPSWGHVRSNAKDNWRRHLIIISKTNKMALTFRYILSAWSTAERQQKTWYCKRVASSGDEERSCRRCQEFFTMRVFAPKQNSEDSFRNRSTYDVFVLRCYCGSSFCDAWVVGGSRLDAASFSNAIGAIIADNKMARCNFASLFLFTLSDLYDGNETLQQPSKKRRLQE